MTRTIVIGSINADIVANTERHPYPGETLHGSSLQQFPGGKGANQAVAAARAGADTFMVGCVGKDASGDELTAYLTSSGVDTGHVRAVEDAPTGTAIITVAGGENTIVVIAGANGLVDEGDIDRLDFQEGDVVLAQFETPPGVTAVAFAKARAVGATTILNPAPAAEVGSDLLRTTSILVVNEHEFDLVFSDVDVASTVAEEPAALSRLHELFSGTVVLTLGASGALGVTPNGIRRVPGLQVDALDSTGAGDCFTGYLGAGLAAGLDLSSSLERANAAAALSVTRAGAASSIPMAQELES